MKSDDEKTNAGSRIDYHSDSLSVSENIKRMASDLREAAALIGKKELLEMSQDELYAFVAAKVKARTFQKYLNNLRREAVLFFRRRSK